MIEFAAIGRPGGYTSPRDTVQLRSPDDVYAEARAAGRISNTPARERREGRLSSKTPASRQRDSDGITFSEVPVESVDSRIRLLAEQACRFACNELGIGGAVTVRWFRECDEEDRLGFHSSEEPDSIYICTGLSDRRTVDVAIHETIHAWQQGREGPHRAETTYRQEVEAETRAATIARRFWQAPAPAVVPTVRPRRDGWY